jgi:hypothetical protein
MLPSTQQSEVHGAALRRFFPTVLLLLAVLMPLASGSWSPLTVTGFGLGHLSDSWPRTIASLILAASTATAGFDVAASQLRTHLRPDVDLLGSTSVLAGFVALGIILGVGFLFHPRAIEAVATVFFGGALATLVVYFPWLQRADAAHS